MSKSSDEVGRTVDGGPVSVKQPSNTTDVPVVRYGVHPYTPYTHGKNPCGLPIPMHITNCIMNSNKFSQFRALLETISYGLELKYIITIYKKLSKVEISKCPQSKLTNNSETALKTSRK